MYVIHSASATIHRRSHSQVLVDAMKSSRARPAGRRNFRDRRSRLTGTARSPVASRKSCIVNLEKFPGAASRQGHLLLTDSRQARSARWRVFPLPRGEGQGEGGASPTHGPHPGPSADGTHHRSDGLTVDRILANGTAGREKCSPAVRRPGNADRKSRQEQNDQDREHHHGTVSRGGIARAGPARTGRYSY
jgi:hypothetical protein